MKTLVVFDGNSIINRAFYAVRPLTSHTGLHTNALYGFVNIINKHLAQRKPDYAVVAFDLRAPTFRHKRYDGYKATRKAMPEELAEQMPYARTLSRALGLSVLEIEGYEADDILGTLSAIGDQNGLQTYLVTGDRDSFQLVSSSTSVVLAQTGADVLYDPAKIEEKYGLLPKQLIDVKSLAGDSSDNIPGVRGIGEKGALRLIAEAGSLQHLYENLDACSCSPSVREKLEQGKESAFLSYELAEICRTVPGVPDLEELRKKPFDKEALMRLFSELDFSRLGALFGLDGSNVPAPGQGKNPPSEEGGQVSFATVGEPEEEAQEQVPELLSLSASRALAGTLFVLFEGDAPVCLCGDRFFTIEPSDCAAFLRASRPVVFDAKAYYHFCAEHGVEPDESDVLFDLKTASYLLDPTGAAQSPERAAMVFLSRLIGAHPPKRKLLSLFADLYQELSPRLTREGLEPLYRDIELPLSRVLCNMERVGFLVDRAGLLAYGEELKRTITALERAIYEASEVEFNLNSPRQLGEVLFGKLGLPHARKTKTGFSTDAETLEKLKALSPVVRDILEYRKLSKLYGTYVEGLSRCSDAQGRVHTTFLQTQTVTGRLSSADPNLQNIPVRTVEGRELRRFFVAQPGWVLVDADYSQVELRILAHLSGDEAFCEAFRTGVDIHARTASEMFHVPLSEVTPEMRKDAKAINFGIVYGIGEFSLSQDLGVSRARAAEYISEYFRGYPKVKEYLEAVVREARQRGFVRTLYGRVRSVPELSSPKKQMQAFGERVAMNTPVQGTAADIIKRAMVCIDERIRREGIAARLILQVHDEVIVECDESQEQTVRALVKEEMERAATLSVTLTADVGAGKTWLEAKE